jgi:hypothetical protein
MNSRFLTSTDPEFLATQSRPTERTREANARALATAGNKVSPQNLYQSGTVSIDPPNITANTRASVSVTIENVAPGDFVIMNPPSGLNAGLAYAGAIVAAADTVTVFIANITGGGINDGANVWEYMAVRLS